MVQANIHLDGQILKEEALQIKKHLNNDQFLIFKHPKDGCENVKYRMALEKK